MPFDFWPDSVDAMPTREFLLFRHKASQFTRTWSALHDMLSAAPAPAPAPTHVGAGTGEGEGEGSAGADGGAAVANADKEAATTPCADLTGDPIPAGLSDQWFKPQIEQLAKLLDFDAAEFLRDGFQRAHRRFPATAARRASNAVTWQAMESAVAATLGNASLASVSGLVPTSTDGGIRIDFRRGAGLALRRPTTTRAMFAALTRSLEAPPTGSSTSSRGNRNGERVGDSGDGGGGGPAGGEEPLSVRPTQRLLRRFGTRRL